MSSKKAASVLEIAGIVNNEVEKDRELMVSWFGKWSVRTKSPRCGWNPKTGVILRWKVILFKNSPRLRKTVHARAE
jgi:nucleoid DNA-binding protein